MPLSKIIRMGDANLATPSLEVGNLSKSEASLLIKAMESAMKEHGGVGIAAPQIGINLRVILFGFERNERYPNEGPIPFTVLINPSFEPLSDEMVEGWEGCLSIPGLRGYVPRYNKIRYRGYDLDNKLIEREVEGFHARVIQHECDHIDGILYPQRIKNMRFFGFEEELKEVIWPKK